jgi:hypothetical protein
MYWAQRNQNHGQGAPPHPHPRAARLPPGLTTTS